MADDIQRFLAGGFWLCVSMWKTCFEYVRYVLPLGNVVGYLCVKGKFYVHPCWGHFKGLRSVLGV